ncbi:hypothetical protein MVEG_00107 [Podila verticillata NRRL 6337]|nr:hypothetical protein MVEG_00107 [Podila verticillata NRRL 6337]
MREEKLPFRLRVPEGNRPPSLLGTRQETCLWAHRTILTKYPVFDDLIKQASFANPKAGVEPVQVTLTKVSLGTFAVLLKYIYLGKVQRHNYPVQFAISLSNHWSPTTTGGCKDAHRWYSKDLGTPLSAEPVTWQELLDAATIYKVDALRARCESALKVIDKVNIARS